MSVRYPRICGKILMMIKKIIKTALIAGLGLTKYLFFWVRPKKIGNAQNILIIKLERIGDIVLSTPAVHAVKKRFPDSRIIAVIPEKFIPIIENDPALDEIIPYSQKNGLIPLIIELRKKNIDLAIDLTTREFSFKGELIAALSSSKVTLGSNVANRGFLFNLKSEAYRNPVYLTKEVLHILSPLGVDETETLPKLYASKEYQEEAKKFFTANNHIMGPVVCIHPFGHYPSQEWGVKNYALLIQYIVSRHKALLFLTGTGSEAKVIDEIIARSGVPAYNLASLRLAQSIAYISMADFFIGSSSGPLHIATGFNIPTIAIIGPTIRKRWQWEDANHIVIEKDPGCKPCPGRCVKNNYSCIQSITPQEVMATLDELVKEKWKD